MMRTKVHGLALLKGRCHWIEKVIRLGSGESNILGRSFFGGRCTAWLTCVVNISVFPNSSMKASRVQFA